jgi:hypothetical protein
MPTNNKASISYQAFVRCLSNWARCFYIEDLVQTCHEAFYQYNVNKKECGVKKRQVQENLKFLESEDGYRMDIGAIRDGHCIYYRYPL